MTTSRWRWLVAVTVLATGLHALTPAGPHSWHWLHLVAQRLYYVPILMAAAWSGMGVTLATTLVVSLLSVVHILKDWAGLPMVQAEELAQLAGFWITAPLAAALFARERRALEEVRQAHGETLGALASSLELRERYTGGHSRRVRDYSLLLADEMGIRDAGLRSSLAQGALLHDVGKIGIPDRILLKPGVLAEEERSAMRRHPELGASLVGDTGWLREAREVILAHHERFDGGGYPRGLAGVAIPLAARIFAVADAFDALTTDRPYHDALSWEEAASKVAAGRGSQFDPDAADAFLRTPFETWARAAAATGVALRRGASVNEQPADRPGTTDSLGNAVAAGTKSEA
jgi:HD domain-containing protein